MDDKEGNRAPSHGNKKNFQAANDKPRLPCKLLTVTSMMIFVPSPCQHFLFIFSVNSNTHVFLHNLWLLCWLCLEVWSEGGSVHGAWLFFQWLVLCPHSGGSPCWTVSATVGPPAWHTHWPTDYFFCHLVPSYWAKWESPSLWAAPQTRQWQQHWWHHDARLQEHLKHL